MCIDHVFDEPEPTPESAVNLLLPLILMEAFC